MLDSRNVKMNKIKKNILFFIVLTITVMIIVAYMSKYLKYQVAMRNRATYMNVTYNALWNSHDVHKVLFYREESGITEKNSWRFYLAPYLGYGGGAITSSPHYDNGKKWNEEPNNSLVIPEFCWEKHISSMTNVMAITGEDTAYVVQKTENLQDCEDLIIMVEVAHTNTHWGEDGDVNVANIPTNITRGIDGNGFMVLFFDGSIWYIKNTIPLDILKRYLTVTEARKHDRNVDLMPYAIVYR